MLRLTPAFNIRLIQDLVFNLSITVGVVIHLCANGGRRLATEVDDAGVCAPTLPVENLNRLEAESVARI